jgi:hypothetical protein
MCGKIKYYAVPEYTVASMESKERTRGEPFLFDSDVFALLVKASGSGPSSE